MHSSIETCPVGILGTWTLRWGLALQKPLRPCRHPYGGGFHGRPRCIAPAGREDGQLTHQSRHRRAGPAPPPRPAGAQPVGREGGGSRGDPPAAPGAPPRRRAPQRARKMQPPHVSTREPREGLQLQRGGGYCSGYVLEPEGRQSKKNTKIKTETRMH